MGIDPGIRHGKPVIKGTRVPVGIILGSLAGGYGGERDCRGIRDSKGRPTCSDRRYEIRNAIIIRELGDTGEYRYNPCSPVSHPNSPFSFHK
ncbi:MAG: hypothetical protein C5S49_02710 [Candidatus Methanogaster sp.]|nr:MAG: hypothetical protein C5S49_02710 [ANME-2 cluster archaeon]